MPERGSPADRPLGDALLTELRRLNPWWRDEPMRPLPATRRHLVAGIRSRLAKRIAPVVLVRGPRQVGKTIAQMQVLADLLAQGTPPDHILRVQFDDLPAERKRPALLLDIVDWYERSVLGKTLNAAARDGEPTYLFLNEAQNLPGWAQMLKHLVDATATQVVVTGSSALRLEMGRDSLAGRISTIEAGVLSLTEIGAFRGVGLGDPALADNGPGPLADRAWWDDLAARGRALGAVRAAAFEAFSDRGGYPMAHERADLEWPDVAEHLTETVVRRVLQHDLRLGERGRKRDAPLLEHVFRLACRYAGQAPSAQALAQDACTALGADLGAQRIGFYLQFLADSLLLHKVAPLEIRLRRARSAPKLCLADHALRAAWLGERIPLSPAALDGAALLHDLAGRIAESVTGAAFCSVAGLSVSHLPETSRGPEVDFVLTVGDCRVPVEVKYRRGLQLARDTEGLRRFLDTPAHGARFGVLVTRDDGEAPPDPRIVRTPLSSLLLMR